MLLLHSQTNANTLVRWQPILIVHLRTNSLPCLPVAEGKEESENYPIIGKKTIQPVVSS